MSQATMVTPATVQPPNADAPIEAFRFTSGLNLSPVAEADGTIPFTTLARTSKPIDHWYWGPCVHDFSGMQMAAVIPVDYTHEDCEALGFINNKTVTPEGLQLSGKLTPFQPLDKASEVHFKSAKGVPYQASINFDPWTLVVEDIPAGLSAEVNGQLIPGPVAVFRQWKLNGLAVCMYGVDSGTNVSFSSDLSGKTVAVTRFKKGEQMPPAKSAATGKFAVLTSDEKKNLESVAATLSNIIETSTEAPADEVDPEAAAEVTPESGAASEPASPEDTQLSRKNEGKKFIEAFGEQHGPTLFTKGFSFSAAQVEYSKILRAENEALRAENAKFAAKPHSSGTTPVSFGTAAKSGTTETKFGGLTGGIAKFASGIKLPAGK